jgi:dienelactone hydrolase
MVHGAAGILSRRDDFAVPDVDNFGEKQFACKGFLVFLPHYLDTTNQVSALNRDDMARNSEVWLRALGDAIDHAIKVRNAQKKRIFLFGESLGGYLSIALASQDRRIKAVSVFGAGMPPGMTLSRMPPVLIQHGEEDEVVSVSQAIKLRDAIQRIGPLRPSKAHTEHIRFVEVKTYPGLGHYATPEALTQIVGAAASFFRTAP